MLGQEYDQIKQARQKASNISSSDDLGNVLKNALNSLQALMIKDHDSEKPKFAETSLKMGLVRNKYANVASGSAIRSMVCGLPEMLETTINWINEREKSRLRLTVYNRNHQKFGVMNEVNKDVGAHDLCDISDYEDEEQNQAVMEHKTPIEKTEIESEGDDLCAVSDHEGENEHDSSKRGGESKQELKYENSDIDEDSDTEIDDDDDSEAENEQLGSKKGDGKFPCDICTKKFAHKCSLKLHRKIHLEDEETRKPHKCDECDYRCSLIGKLNEHKKTHLPPSHECDICGNFLANPKSLRDHRKRHLEEPRFKCEICGKAFFNEDILKSHMKKHTEDEAVWKPHKCEKCEKRFDSLAHLEDHKETHLSLEERRTFECGTCGKLCASMKNLMIHMQTHIEDKPLFQCHLCEKSYNYAATLREHMNTHADTEELKKPHQCDVCGERFTAAGSMKTHKKRKHIREADDTSEKAQCDICGKVLSKHYAMTAHRETHMADGDPRKTKFECGKCGKILSHKSALTAHEKTHLDENNPEQAELKRPHKCEKCGKAYRTAAVLRHHMMRHNGEYPFKCDLCPKKFILEHLLKKHLEAHEKGTVKKPHRRTKFCILCPKKYATRVELERHLKRHQEGTVGSSSEGEGEDLEVIYSCEQCPMKFRSEERFKLHQLQHNGRDDKYKCNVCGLTLGGREYLRKHTLRKHPETATNNESKVRRRTNCEQNAPAKKARLADSESEESDDVSDTNGEDDEINDISDSDKNKN